MIGIHNFGWRLGNQLFQIASLFGICHQAGFQPVIPDSWKYKEYFPNCEKYLGNFQSHLVARIEEFHFINLNINQDNIMLEGYLQSYRYFDFIKPYIQVMFYVKDSETKKGLPCTSIHIRRGDYLKYPNHHPVISLDYYNEAIEKIGKDNSFLIFTDDKEYCRELIQTNKFGTKKIAIYDGKDEIEDYLIMSRCQNNIIANSSFSWWSAYLNQNPDKTVVAPDPHTKWFGPAYKHWNMSDLIPKEWIIV